MASSYFLAVNNAFPSSFKRAPSASSGVSYFGGISTFGGGGGGGAGAADDPEGAIEGPPWPRNISPIPINVKSARCNY